MRPLEDWLSQCPEETGERCLLAFDRFCESAGTDDEDLVEDYKQAKEKNQWAKKVGKIPIRCCNDLLEEGESHLFCS